MLIRLGLVRDEPFSWHRTESISAATLERSELVRLGPIDWSGRVSWADPGFYLRFRAAYEQTLVCNRCLGEVRQPVEAELELLIMVEPSTEGPDERVLKEEDLGVLTVAEEDLELMPLLIEQLQLNIPMKPLCRPDCAGLCARCGADLNGGACECPERETDPRWAALEALRGSLPGGHEGG